MIKSYDIYRYSKNENGEDWKEIVGALFEYDEKFRFIKRLIKEDKGVNEQIKEWEDEGMGKRRSYFLYKKKLNDKLEKGMEMVIV